jgi:hypothetical protein
MTNTDEAAAVFTRVLEALARQTGKTLSPQTRRDVLRACELLANAGAELDELLDDLPSAPRQSPAEAAIEDAPFQRWRSRRATGQDERA